MTFVLYLICFDLDMRYELVDILGWKTASWLRGRSLIKKFYWVICVFLCFRVSCRTKILF